MISPSSTLPTGYRPIEAIDLNNRSSTVGLVVLAGVLAALAAVALMKLVPITRTDWGRWVDVASVLQTGEYPLVSLSLSLAAGISLVGILAAVVVVHELIHGFCFWCFTHVRPDFGRQEGLIYCAIPPGNFLPRNRYLIVALAPVVLLTVLGLALIAWGPLLWVPMIALATILHIAASVGDLWIAACLTVRSSAEYVWDAGAITLVYARG